MGPCWEASAMVSSPMILAGICIGLLILFVQVKKHSGHLRCKLLRFQPDPRLHSYFVYLSRVGAYPSSAEPKRRSIQLLATVKGQTTCSQVRVVAPKANSRVPTRSRRQCLLLTPPESASPVDQLLCLSVSSYKRDLPSGRLRENMLHAVSYHSGVKVACNV